MTLVDHLMILALFVVQPIYGAYAYRRFIARVESGEPRLLVKEYRITMIVEWSALAVLLLTWVILARPLGALGFEAPAGAGFLWGLLLLAITTVYLVYAWRQATRATTEQRKKAEKSFGKLRYFMPYDRRTYTRFFWLSITAGVVEEILYRGFVFWYLGAFMPVWAVVLVSSLAFGLGHSYQGIGGIIRVTLIGLAFGGFYLLTGSIWTHNVHGPGSVTVADKG